MARTQISAIIATTGMIEKYGVALSTRSLFEFAQEIRAGRFPLLLDHDSTQRLNPTFVDIAIVPVGDQSNWGIRVVFELDENELEKLSNRPGFSIAYKTPATPASPQSDKPRITLAVEPGYFDNEDIENSVAALSKSFDVSTSELYQFSEDITFIKVILEFMGAFAVGVGTNAVYDALKHLLRPRLKREYDNESRTTSTIFEFHRRQEIETGKTTITTRAVLKTDNEELLSEAILKLPEAIVQGHPIIHFNPDTGGWEKID